MKAKDYGCTSFLLMLIDIVIGCFELVKVGNQSLRKAIFTLLRIVDLTCRYIIKRARNRISGFFILPNL